MLFRSAFGGTLDPKTLAILLNPFQIWQQMGPLGPFVAKFGVVPGGLKAAQVWHPLRPAGYLVAVSGPLCFGGAYSVHVVLFWVYFELF